MALSHLPEHRLKDINIVDTPGTNAVLRDHQQITEHFVPRSDLIFFVTSVDRAYSESERSFLRYSSM
jgi:predicted GTPase